MTDELNKEYVMKRNLICFKLTQYQISVILYRCLQNAQAPDDRLMHVTHNDRLQPLEETFSSHSWCKVQLGVHAHAVT